jgi:hypothetical protein
MALLDRRERLERNPHTGFIGRPNRSIGALRIEVNRALGFEAIAQRHDARDLRPVTGKGIGSPVDHLTAVASKVSADRRPYEAHQDTDSEIQDSQICSR